MLQQNLGPSTEGSIDRIARKPSLVASMRDVFSKRSDTEHNQAIVRFILTFVFAIYLFGAFHILPGTEQQHSIVAAIIAFELVVATLILFSIYKYPEPWVARRVTGMALDYGCLGTVIIFMGPVATPLYAAVMWVTVGNGLRYGVRHLYLATAFQWTILILVYVFNPYWNANPWFAIAMILAATLLPLYIVQLLKAYKAALAAADRASQAKSRFMAQMSHEFRTPLNSIMAMTQMLASSRLDREDRESAEFIYASAESLLAMVEDVLDIAANESGRIRVDNVDFDLQAMLRRLETGLAPQAAKAGLELVVDTCERAPRALHGDQQRVNQILINLLHNAIKFTKRGSVRLSTFAVEEQGNRVVIQFSVRDTGIGVAPEDRQRIFQPFEQAHTGSSRNFGGIGLGISISRTLAKMMGGDIGVEENPGGGSHFWVRVPFGRVEGVVISSVDDSRADTFGDGKVISMDDTFVRHRMRVKPQRILVVDDQSTNRVVLRRVLERAGHKISEAVDGEDALDQLSKADFDLVVLDLHMPGMNGLEVLGQIRVMEAGAPRKTPVMFLSADATRESKAAVLATKPAAFMLKPVDPHKLLNLVAGIAGLGEADQPQLFAETEDRESPGRGLAHLADVDGSAEFLEDFVRHAFDDIEITINQLRALPFRPSARTARDHLHALRGVARNLGARQLTEACLAWMEQGDQDLVANLKRIPADLEPLVAAARRDAEEQMRDLAAATAKAT